jgi:signal transduction histidine kinase/ligand-binding sensor domain-containing protein
MHMMFRYKAVLWICSLLIVFFNEPIVCLSQPHQLKFRFFGVNDGLSQGNVTCFMQDHLGRMWFGSRGGGLTVFDGFQSTIYKEQLSGKKHLKGDHIYSIIELNSNEVAVTTEAGLNIFYRNKDSFALFKTIEKDQAFEILRRENDELMLGYGSQLLSFNVRTKKFQIVGSKKGNRYNDVMKLRNSGSHHSEYLVPRLYAMIEDQTCPIDQLKSVLSSHKLNDILLDTANKHIYLATHAGFLCYQMRTSKYSDTILKGSMKALFRHGNNLFLGTKDSGMYVYSLTDQKFTAHYAAQEEEVRHGISGNYIRNFFVDRQENLWISALMSGVNYCKLYPEIAQVFFSKQDKHLRPVVRPHIASICTDKDNKLWVVDISGSIVVLDDQYQLLRSFTSKDIDPVRLPFSIQQIYASRHNTIYVLSEDGLYYSNDHRQFKLAKNTDQKFHVDNMYYIYELNDTSALLSTSKGVFRLNTKANTISNRDTLLKNPKVPRFIYGDQKGNMYIQIDLQGFGVYADQGKKLKLERSIPFQANLNCSYETKDTIWFGTSKGILGFNKHTYLTKLLNEENELPHQFISSIQPDPREGQSVWCSGLKGIFKYNLASGQSFGIGIHDGLSTIEYHGNSCRRKNGDLVFCSIDGIARINPLYIQPEKKVNELVVFQFKLNNAFPDSNAIDIKQNQYTIPYAHNSISFRLMQINFPANSFPIRFRLIGLETRWNTEMNPIEIRYPNLREGRYTFVAQYYNRNRGWVEKKFFDIHILPPWYRSWYAYLLYALISLSIIWIVFRIYVNMKLNQQRADIEKQQALMNERSRISADLHDDIGATLSSMHLYSDMAQSRWESHPEQSKDMVCRIKEQSSELMSNMSDIIWSMKTSGSEQYSLKNRLLQMKTDLLNPAGIDLELDFDTDIERLLQQPLFRKNVLLILKEALNNIAKYSGADTVHIHFHQHEMNLLLEIVDNGRGFSKDATHNGNGLQNMRNRAQQLGGECKIQSETGKGCTIRCRFPIANSSYLHSEK